jgi:chemotaxis protein histidine kinase CheA/CheY-like chemotaxis protein
MDPEMRELLELFREESLERLGKVSRAAERLAEVDFAGRKALLDEIDRELHTVKGSASMLGFMALKGLVHESEGLARAIRKELTHTTRELLVETADRLSALVSQCAQGGKDAGDDALEARIRLAAGDSAVRKGSPPGVPPVAGTPHRSDAPTASFRLSRKLPTKPAVDPDKPTAPLEKTKLAPATELAAPRPAPVEHDAPTPTPGSAELREIAQRSDPGTDTKRLGKEKGGPNAPKPEDDTADLVRVRASKLSQLDGFVSELSLAKLRLDAFEDKLRELAAELEGRTEDPAGAATLVRRLARRFREDRVHLGRAAKGLERLAIDVRLRPVGRVFDSLPKEARDLARRLGKKVRTRIKGAQTELDRAILDGVKDPLVHIIRNTIDHGIEPPEERRAQGKPEEGSIDIEAAQDGGSVLIHVRDDGRGIDPEKVRAAAVRKGVITAEAARRLSSEEAIDLVFLPGFSTKDQVTDISGRGVGMDIVKKNVESLKGEVRVRTKIGEGTEVTLRLPLTVLVSRVLFFRAGDTLAGVPTSAVESTAVVGANEMGLFEGKPTVRHRGRQVPVAKVTTLLGLSETRDDATTHADRLAIVRHNEEALALSVTSFEGEKSVVVKPLGWPLERIRGTAGAVILGTGDTALLLHVPDLLALSHEQGRAAPAPRPSAQEKKKVRRRRVLIVDDSVITRQLERRILEGMGFEVELANDGQDALRFLERGDLPDVVITDVEMPRLDGLGLVRRIRRESKTQDLPVVIVSTRGADEDRRAGLEAGADAYIVKAEFDEKTLRETIDRLLG